MKDKNCVEIKHKDIIKITGEDWLCKDGDIFAVKTGEGEHVNKPVIYNPNCCAVCRQTESTWGCIDDLDFLNPQSIEVIGNLDTTPELLPLEALEE